jgi:hypothetical protein
MTAGGGASPYGVVTFRTTSAAYASEKALLRAGLQVKVIPVPRSLSTDCCLGLRIEWPQREAVQEALRRAGVAFVAVFPL